jgi:hypothetical protein
MAHETVLAEIDSVLADYEAAEKQYKRPSDHSDDGSYIAAPASTLAKITSLLRATIMPVLGCPGCPLLTPPTNLAKGKKRGVTAMPSEPEFKDFGSEADSTSRFAASDRGRTSHG